MTPEQLKTLQFFDATERFTHGAPVEWDRVSYQTMVWIDLLRRRLGFPVYLIRGDHGPDGSAVDWTCPGTSYARVVMEVLRIPCSQGFYSGGSVHCDTRPPGHAQNHARWMAVRESDERHLLGGLRKLIYRRADGWIYLLWSEQDGLAFQALTVVVRLAEWRRQQPADTPA